MATTVNYKGSVLTTVDNQTRTLHTSGKYMEGDITLVDVTGGATAISVVDTLDPGGGTIRTITAVDISNDTVAASNLLQGYTAHDRQGNLVNGTAVAGQVNNQDKTVNPSTSQQTVTADAGYTGLGTVTINAVPTADSPYAGNLTINSNGSITVDVEYDDGGYVGGGTYPITKTNAVTVRGVNDLTVSGGTVSAPAGYYPSSVGTTVSQGTAGTPTASKGSVSNHSISVTPSVTNTTGYITGSTKTGTAVTVSASELVSGTKLIDQNGTSIDVTNYQYVDVAVSGGSVQYDTKTTTASNYPTSLSFTSMKGEPKAFVVRLNAQVSSSGNTTYYYIVDICAFGTTTHGNCFRIGSTRRVDNITSGYSWSYSGTTLTITSSAASRSASPGAFYSGSYELLYAY